MSDGFPERMKVQTSTLKSGIAYGIASLGAVPLRYGQPRFPSLRRRFQNDTQSKRLLKGDDPSNLVPPDIFALATFNALTKPTSQQQGNHAALRHGVNFKSSNGQLTRLHGSYVEIPCNAMIYATSLDLLFDWMDSAFTQSTIRGMSEFADGGSVPIKVEITPNFAWTDPVEQTEGVNWVDRLYAISVDFNILTVAAHLTTNPLYKGYTLVTQVGKAEEEIVELPSVDPEDWP